MVGSLQSINSKFYLRVSNVLNFAKKYILKTAVQLHIIKNPACLLKLQTLKICTKSDGIAASPFLFNTQDFDCPDPSASLASCYAATPTLFICVAHEAIIIGIR